MSKDADAASPHGDGQGGSWEVDKEAEAAVNARHAFPGDENINEYMIRFSMSH